MCPPLIESSVEYNLKQHAGYHKNIIHASEKCVVNAINRKKGLRWKNLTSISL
jgi:hypothetical protein